MINTKKEVSVNFSIQSHVPFGKAVYLVGNTPELGEWHCERAHKLRHSYGDHWNTSVKIRKYPPQIQYKFFIANFDAINKNQIEWENLEGNRHLNLLEASEEFFSSVSMCSFNIRLLNDKDHGLTHWDARKDRIFEYFDQNAYDFIGIQQATYLQRTYLEQLMDKYQYYGKKRQQENDEECGIFVRKNRFIILQEHCDWISETKEEGLSGYDADKPRYFTSLLVAPVITASCVKMTCFLIINLHLDDLGAYARKKGVEQILAKCIQLKKNLCENQFYDLSGCIIMGDFNESENSSCLQILCKNEHMPFESMRKIQGADRSCTFNGFQNKYLLKMEEMLIGKMLTVDHMFYWVKEKEALTPVRFEVHRSVASEYLSDHFPIYGNFKRQLAFES